VYDAVEPGEFGVIQDMSHEASAADIRREVDTTALPRRAALMTRWILTALRLRALSPERFRRLAAESAFHGGEVNAAGLGLEVRLRKQYG
jgi:hypothetical protein